ncbi:cell cycle protein [Rubrobacter xylanophilus DSM 9941]|uniref:Probable peptidoglycan glycosyltransferase FtsW n=1 Tax=Rubrobacter xylanophilus (strain DSM 9941 / JCM 11954 / NBRC 16129 / PRD-1) TaxID=266117 RepID=Q1AVX2_RUBXD|nr:FtsW/RodA/SpoVE family cell cycle protein [Rubrobacter xylanophilus]ABG04456.1 cell cycle protein [Rubrobacter xylanophilus DSM 9941]
MSALRSNLFLLALGLSLLGTVMVYSATYREFGAHYLFVRAAHVALGVLAFLLASRVRYTLWRRLAPWLYLGTVAGLVLVFVPGVGVRAGGAWRWVDLGFFTLQPGELAKLAAVISLSCAAARLPAGAGLPARALGAVGVLFGLVLVEPDFGTSLVVLAGAAGVLWASEVRTRDLLLCGAAAGAALVAVMLLAPYRRERFVTFLDPWAAADGSGYQVVQGMLAISSGGLFGEGAGAGSRSAAVPELATDMIFALVGEELGLLGMAAVIVAFGLLGAWGVQVALAAPSALARCMAFGLTAVLCVQALLNMGAVMVVLPLAGITLPFVSYGGSSLLVSFAAVGVLYRISEDGERAREVRGGRRPPARRDSGRRYGRPRDPRAVRG